MAVYFHVLGIDTMIPHLPKRSNPPDAKEL